MIRLIDKEMTAIEKIVHSTQFPRLSIRVALESGTWHTWGRWGLSQGRGRWELHASTFTVVSKGRNGKSG